MLASESELELAGFGGGVREAVNITITTQRGGAGCRSARRGGVGCTSSGSQRGTWEVLNSEGRPGGGVAFARTHACMVRRPLLLLLLDLLADSGNSGHCTLDTGYTFSMQVCMHTMDMHGSAPGTGRTIDTYATNVEVQTQSQS